MPHEVTTGARRGCRAPVATAPSRRTDRGAVTAEAAAVLPLLVAVAIGLVWLVALAAAQVRVVDAAREVARVAARGESEAAATAHGRQVAPDGTRFTVARGADEVRVTAAVEVDGPGGLFRFLPGVEVQAASVAATEPP
jgi:Flp pilus assembly protein TadG